MNNNNRSVTEVAQVILRLIPKNFKYYDGISYDIKEIIESSCYCPPEAVGFQWEKLSKILERYLGEPDEDFKKLISEIFSAQLDYRLFYHALLTGKIEDVPLEFDKTFRDNLDKILA